MPYKNKEVEKAYRKRYKALHKERLLAYERSRYHKNIDKERARGVENARLQSSRRKAYSQQWQLANPAKRATAEAKRRAAKLQRTPKWLTSSHLDQIQMFYEAAAVLSKELNINFEVDHIMPLQGRNSSGLHVPWNLQVITASENRRKHNKD